jgi:hypothetical protein
MQAAIRSFIVCGRSLHRESIETAAALLLHIAEASEKQEKGEKPESRYGLTRDEARSLMVRILCGQRVRLTADGRFEMIDE